jgi:hypothetical protein
VFGSLLIGVILVVIGLSLVFGGCESVDLVGGSRHVLACAPDGQGPVSADLAGLVVAGVGMVVFGIAGAVVALDFRRKPPLRRRRR